MRDYNGLKPEINEQPSKILTVVFDAVIEWFDMRLLQETLHFFPQLPAAFSGNDLYFPDLFFNGIVKCLLQGFVNGLTVVVYIMKVNFYTGHLYVMSLGLSVMGKSRLSF